MTLNDLKDRCVEIVQTAHPTKKIYSIAVTENFKRPAIFLVLKPTVADPTNYNSRHNLFTLIITYFQSVVDEYDALDFIDGIRNLFGLSIKVGDRAVKVVDFSYDFVGTKRNIPEISLDLEWYDRIEHPETTDLMETAVINQHLEEEN